MASAGLSTTVVMKLITAKKKKQFKYAKMADAVSLDLVMNWYNVLGCVV